MKGGEWYEKEKRNLVGGLTYFAGWRISGICPGRQLSKTDDGTDAEAVEAGRLEQRAVCSSHTAISGED